MISGQQILEEGKKFLGDPYAYGAAGPSSFDCSGLVQYVLSQLGMHGVPRTSEDQWAWVQKIDRSQLQVGDLIFEQWPGDDTAPGHVVIYAGGGQVLEAPHTGANVRLRSWSPSETTIVGYGRVPGAAGGGTGGGGGGSGLLGGLISFPADVLGVFKTGEQLLAKLMWLFNPENWARIVAGLFGVLLAAFGIGFLIKAGI